ncbi:MAG: hypothetical protein K2G88_10410 [Oscillospiraceae bacterium]|nr:hypothetical protein [Oscillospiraceae bacterium]
MKKLKYTLILLGVFMALTGCGKKTEEIAPLEADSTTTVAETVENFGSGEETTESETESESETETTQADTTETEHSETDVEASTEASSSETDKQDISSTNKSSTVATTVTKNLVTSTEAPATTQNANTIIGSSVTDIAPSETDPPVIDPPSTEPEPIITDSPVTAPPVTEPPVSTGSPSDLSITYQGQTLAIGDNAQDFVNAVKPNFEESAPSCYGNGENINYYYDGMTVYVWNENDNYLVYGIDVDASNIAPAQGYDIGSTADFEGQKIIDCGDNCNIIITEVGGQVINISYNKDL